MMEYEKLYVGDKLSPITKVVVHIMDGNKFTSGTEGRTLNVDCPWGSQAVADIILAAVSGYRYTPFTAEQAIIDPSIELGDIIEDGSLRERVYQNNSMYCSALLATLGAMEEKELDHDYPFKSSSARGGARAANKAKDEAERKILEEHNALVAALNREDGAPEDLAAGIDNYVRYDLDGDTAFAGSLLAAAVGNRAKAEIAAYVVKDDAGNSRSFVQILADVIKLAGRVDVTGRLSVSDGNVRVLDGNLVMAGGNIIALQGKSQFREASADKLSTSELYVQQNKYTPTEITSSTGQIVSALGV